MPTPGASKTTNMHADAAMDMEKLFGVYGGVISWKTILKLLTIFFRFGLLVALWLGESSFFGVPLNPCCRLRCHHQLCRQVGGDSGRRGLDRSHASSWGAGRHGQLQHGRLAWNLESLAGRLQAASKELAFQGCSIDFHPSVVSKNAPCRGFRSLVNGTAAPRCWARTAAQAACWKLRSCWRPSLREAFGPTPAA